MAVVSYNKSKNGKNNSLIVYGDEEELKKIAKYVNHMHDKPVGNNDNNEGAIDMVNEPPHYIHGMECIDEMILVFGKEAVMNFCLCNAWKYRYRAPYKGDIEENMEKSRWYLNKYKELKCPTDTIKNPYPNPYTNPYTKVWCATTTNKITTNKINN